MYVQIQISLLCNPFIPADQTCIHVNSVLLKPDGTAHNEKSE